MVSIPGPVFECDRGLFPLAASYLDTDRRLRAEIPQIFYGDHIGLVNTKDLPKVAQEDLDALRVSRTCTAAQSSR